MNVQQLLESANPFKSQQSDAQRLVSKWNKSGLLEGLKSDIEKTNISVMLENQAKQLVLEGNVTGGTNSQNGGGYNSENWAGVALPLVRRVFGDISAKEFLSVQPMNLPSGLVFYLDFKYGTSKSPFTSGTSMYGSNDTTNVTDTTGGLFGAGRFSYSINNTTASLAAVPTSGTLASVNQDTQYSASAARNEIKVITIASASLAANADAVNYDPNGVRAFTITSGSAITVAKTLQAFTAVQSNGDITFVVTGSSSTIESGSVTLAFQKKTLVDKRGDFEDGSTYSQSNPIAIPEIQVQMKSESIVAKTRKLKAQWSPEFAQDLNAYQSIDAESELTGMLSQYVSMEIDLELIDMLIQNAYTVDYWSAKNNTFYNPATSLFVTSTLSAGDPFYYNGQGGWFQTIGTKLQKVSNKIHQLTMRGGANFMIVSPTVATVLESIPGFAADSAGDKEDFNFGVQKIGSLNSRYKVWKNPYMTENVILMGYRGGQFLECGAVFAPYVPLIMTPLLYDPDTFTPRKGLMTRYAKKMIRPDYYGKVYVAHLETV